MSSLVNNIALFEAADSLLRKLIFSHTLKPGDRIDEQALAREFGISRTPLREALKVLHNDGLVKLVPRRGCFVAKLNERDMDEIYEMIALLEGECAGRAAEQASEGEIARLRRITQRMMQMAADKNYKKYFEANLAAHEVILEIAGNRWQRNIIEYLRSMCRLWPRVSLGVIPERLDESLEEHRQILDAIERRDRARAEGVMRKHVANTREALRKLAAA